MTYRKGRPASRIDQAAGIPLHAVTGLARDPEGNIWASSGGSFDGAFCWDGKSWKLWFINSGYYLVSLLLMGSLLSVWK